MKQKLLEKAFEAYENAYAPYSQFHVGAAVLLSNNEIVLGANIENASYGLTSCAERNALFNVYSQGYQKHDIQMIAIVTKAKTLTTPCGACRQVLKELLPKNTVILLSNEKITKETTIEALLPDGFTSEDLI